MEGETSWSSYCTDSSRNGALQLDLLTDPNDEADRDVCGVTLDLILPDDLLERILAYLPVASIFRAGCVCKRWHEIVKSKRFLWNAARVYSVRPWYFMFTSSDEPAGHAYDPVLRKWYAIDLPCIEKSNWFVASSSGLVCFMDNDTRSELHVCNPLTRSCRRLPEHPGPKSPDYSALAVDRASPRRYTVAVVKSKQAPGEDFLRWDLSIHLYDSGAAAWSTPLTEALAGWRGGDESVICNGVLYFLVYSTGGVAENRHGVVTYDLRAATKLLMGSFVAVPCALTCGRLMSLGGRVVMVGGIGRRDRPGIIKGIGIWALGDGTGAGAGTGWEEIARMPHKYFQGFGELDDVFASSGADEVIYVQSYGSPALLMFDLRQRQWKWAQKCPVVKRFPLQLFTGFCFEPRLEIAP